VDRLLGAQAVLIFAVAFSGGECIMGLSAAPSGLDSGAWGRSLSRKSAGVGFSDPPWQPH
jgi:hypothetical protein